MNGKKILLHEITLEGFETLIRECIRSELLANHNKEPPHKPPDYISVKEAQNMLGISRPTIDKYIRKNFLKSYRIGRTIRLRKNEVESAIRSISSVKHSRNQF